MSPANYPNSSHSSHLAPPRLRSFRAGFSLVEVALSLSIIGFAFIGVLGLMANGIGQFRSALDSTITAQIAQRVLNDVEQAEFRTLIDAANLAAHRDNPEFTFRAPSIAAPALRYFDEQGTEIVPEGDALSPAETARVVYHVNTRIRPQADVPRDDATPEPDLAQVTVQVAAHGGAADSPVETEAGPTENLFKLPPGIPVFTYSALVGRNE